MAITYLLKIDDTLMEGIKAFDVSPEKIYDEAGRTLDGELKATFVGEFPKIAVTFRSTTQSEMQAILTQLRKPFMTVEWWNELDNTFSTGTFYPSSFTYKLISKNNVRYADISVNLISTSKLE